MTNQTRSEVAQCATLIRQDLKKNFPNIKFRVQSQSYTGGNSIRVKYENAIPTEAIENLLAKYQDGHFDGMTDCYNYDKNPENLPRTKYLFVEREVSEENREKIKKQIANEYGIENIEDEQEWRRRTGGWSNEAIWHRLKKTTF